MMVVPSTYHKAIKYPTEKGIKEIRGDQEKTIICYNAIMEDVVLHRNHRTYPPNNARTKVS